MGRDWSTIDSMLQGIDRYVINRELNAKPTNRNETNVKTFKI